MNITVNGKGINVGDALRERAETNLADAIGKYFPNPIDANVVVSKQGHAFHVEISAHPNRGLLVHGKGEGGDAHGAFDIAAERIAKQMRRYHRRMTNHKGKGAEENLTAQHYVVQAEPEHEELPEETQPTIIAEMPAEIPTLSVGSAVMKMDLADQPVQMFRDSKTGRLNVVYRRSDGNIGWIDPAEAAG